MPPHLAGACGHKFCLPCLRQYISGKVTDRVFPIPCPLPDCKMPVSAAECGLVLTAEEQVTLGKVWDCVAVCCCFALLAAAVGFRAWLAYLQWRALLCHATLHADGNGGCGGRGSSFVLPQQEVLPAADRRRQAGQHRYGVPLLHRAALRQLRGGVAPGDDLPAIPGWQGRRGTAGAARRRQRRTAMWMQDLLSRLALVLETRLPRTCALTTGMQANFMRILSCCLGWCRRSLAPCAARTTRLCSIWRSRRGCAAALAAAKWWRGHRGAPTCTAAVAPSSAIAAVRARRGVPATTATVSPRRSSGCTLPPRWQSRCRRSSRRRKQ